MRLVWRQTALNDRSKIMDHIILHNPEAAIALDENFRIESGKRSAASEPLQKRQSPWNAGDSCNL